MSWEVRQGDCLTALRAMDDQSADLVFTSPPYEDVRSYGELDFNLKGEEWVAWALERFIECSRVCRGLVAWVVEGKTRQRAWSATPVLLMAALLEAGLTLRKPPIYYRYGIFGSGGDDWLRNDYEFVVCATRGGRLPWSENTAMGHPPKYAPGGEASHRTANGRRVNQWGHSIATGATQLAEGKVRSGGRRPSHREIKRYDGVTLANPGNVIRCKVGGGLMGSKLAHENEAPFPERLAEFFIRSFCPAGGVVIDPFSGSGTTAAVAARLGRHAIAIDARASQCELTRRRIEEVLQQETFGFVKQ